MQALIDAVEAAYQSGVTDYHEGKLQTAKGSRSRSRHDADQQFRPADRTRLRDEFDRILDAVNTLETEALKRAMDSPPSSNRLRSTLPTM